MLLPHDLLGLADLFMRFAGDLFDRPLAFSFLLSLSFPAVSLILPFTSWRVPSTLSLVLDFMVVSFLS